MKNACAIYYALILFSLLKINLFNRDETFRGKSFKKKPLTLIDCQYLRYLFIIISSFNFLAKKKNIF